MEKSQSRTTLWITIVAALPVVYVLSIGPVAWVLLKQLHTTEAPGWVSAFYYPLEWLGNHWPAFDSAMRGYSKLWGLK